jgi:hypothetical protein
MLQLGLPGLGLLELLLGLVKLRQKPLLLMCKAVLMLQPGRLVVVQLGLWMLLMLMLLLLLAHHLLAALVVLKAAAARARALTSLRVQAALSRQHWRPQLLWMKRCVRQLHCC